MNLTKRDAIIKDGTEVLINDVIGKVCGNDSETCDLSDGKYIDLNYYIVPNGETFDDEIMCRDDEFIVLGDTKTCHNCGIVITVDLDFKKDDLGKCTICPGCGSSADLEMYYEK